MILQRIKSAFTRPAPAKLKEIWRESDQKSEAFQQEKERIKESLDRGARIKPKRRTV